MDVDKQLIPALANPSTSNLTCNQTMCTLSPTKIATPLVAALLHRVEVQQQVSGVSGMITLSPFSLSPYLPSFTSPMCFLNCHSLVAAFLHQVKVQQQVSVVSGTPLPPLSFPFPLENPSTSSLACNHTITLSPTKIVTPL